MNKKDTFKNPVSTVDIIIETPKGIVIIERANEPSGLALPGGFTDYNEYLWHAAIREAKEETSLDVELLEQFYVYSGPKRDARLSAVSTVFIARANGEPMAADDAKIAAVISLDHLAAMAKSGTFVFDHNEIIQDYLTYKKTGKRPGPMR